MNNSWIEDLTTPIDLKDKNSFNHFSKEVFTELRKGNSILCQLNGNFIRIEQKLDKIKVSKTAMPVSRVSLFKQLSNNLRQYLRAS